MEVKHTSLPWVAEQDGGKGAWIKRAGAASGDWSAMSCGNTHEEADANTAFIVRACNSHYDLLNALKLFVRAEEMARDGAPPHDADALIEIGKVAIAKAEGRS